MHLNEALKLRAFRIIVGFSAIYHIVLGVAGTLAGPSLVLSVSSAIYGIAPTADAQFLVVGRFAAAYMTAFGIMLGLLAYDPRRYSMLVWPAVALFAIRIFDRLVYAGQLEEAFGTTLGRSLVTVGFAAILLAALLLLRPTAGSSGSPTQ